MASSAVVPGLLAAGSQRALLDAFTAAIDAGAPVAVGDATWPAGVRTDLKALVCESIADGRLRAGEFVVFSSGSTGAARAVRRTIDSWRASAASLTSLLGLRADDVVGIPGPLSSSLYLHGAWHAREAECEVVLADESEAWSKVTVVHAVPGLIASWPHLPPRLRVVVLGGDRVPAGLRERLLAARVRIVEYYGSSEASFVLVRVHEPGRHASDDPSFTALGHEPCRLEPCRLEPCPLEPFPGVEVRVDSAGVLWSHSELAFTGYLSAGPARWDGRWLSVGDRATPAGSGYRMLGRPGTISTGGHTVVCAEVEAAVLATCPVKDVVVVGVPDARLGQVVTAVVSTGSASLRDSHAARLDEASLRRAVRMLPAAARPRRWIQVAALPRLASGKPDLTACERLATEAARR